MSKAYFIGSELQTATHTFGAWVGRTNDLIYEMGVSVVTTGLDAVGDTTIGNAYIQGTFAADDLVVSATGKLRGGTTIANGTLYVGSDIVFDALQDVDGVTAITATFQGATTFNAATTHTSDITFTGASGTFFTIQSGVETTTITSPDMVINGSTSLVVSSPTVTLTPATIFDVTSDTIVLSTADTADYDILLANSNGTVTDVTFQSSNLLNINSAALMTVTAAAGLTESVTGTAAKTSTTWNENFTNSTLTGTGGFFTLTSPILTLNSANMDIAGALLDIDSVTTNITSTTLGISAGDVNFTGTTLDISNVLTVTGVTNLNGSDTNITGTTLDVSTGDVNFTGTSFDVSNVFTTTGVANLNGATNNVAGTNFNISATTTTLSGTSFNGNVGTAVTLQGTSTFGSAGKTVQINGAVFDVNSVATDFAGTVAIQGAVDINSTMTSGDITIDVDATPTLNLSTFANVSALLGGVAGGELVVQTKADGGALTNAIIIDENQLVAMQANASVGGTLAVIGTSNFTGLITGEITTAQKWSTTRTISLTGEVTGSASIDGSSNISIVATMSTHAHSGADITSGVVGITYLPTGTTGTTLALGNHVHSAADITSGSIAWDRVSARGGVIANSFAFGNHTHGDTIPETGGNMTGMLSFNNTFGIQLKESTDTTAYTAVVMTASNVMEFGSSSYATVINGTSLKHGTATVITSSNFAAQVNHDSLTGFVANEHIDHTAVSITAGTGLTGGGTIAANRTLNVVGGDGITANADDIAITWGGNGSALTVSRSDHTHSYDNFGNWDFTTDTAGNISINSGALLTFVGGSQMNVTHSASTITIAHADTSSQASLVALTGANVVSDIDVDINGHITAMTTRALTLGDIGAAATVHNHDSAYVGIAGDTMTGLLTVGAGGTTYLGLYANTSSGIGGDSIRAKGDVTSFYSDMRLKTNITPIYNALDKINSISGVTYSHNQTAVANDLISKEALNNRHVGVLAQEIQAVLPEAVALAPFDIDMDHEAIHGEQVSKSGENYLTVKYEKLVALLIEGIKDLSNKNDDLEYRLAALEGKQ